MISGPMTPSLQRSDVAGIVWSCVRAPIVAILVLLEPLVGFVLYVLAILGLFTTFLFRFMDVGKHFPFWTMLCISLSFALAHLGYHLVIRLLAGLR
jgi:hypothetical protein